MGIWKNFKLENSELLTSWNTCLPKDNWYITAGEHFLAVTFRSHKNKHLILMPCKSMLSYAGLKLVG